MDPISALAIWLAFGLATEAEAGPVEVRRRRPFRGTIRPVSSWRKGSAVLLSPRLEGFLTALSERVPGVSLYVTSGIRTPGEQARAMLAKVAAGGTGSLSIYGRKDLVAELLNTGSRDVEHWTSVIQSQVNRGQFLSRHLRGDALDLRRRDLPAEHVEAIVAAVRELGAKPLVESHPPHIHLERIP